MEERIIQLFIKEQANDLTEAEQLELQQYLVSPEYKSIYDDLQNQWQSAGKLKAAPHADTQASWERIERELPSRSRSLSFTSAILRVAAILLVGLSIAFYFFYSTSQSIEQLTGAGEKREITLPDGSYVYLNENSRVAYTAAFGKKERTLTFQGEAFFEVKRDEAKPFTINTDEATVQVLGTSFNVESYPHQNYTAVSVTSGKVSFTNRDDGASVILEKGMYALLDKATGKLTTTLPNFNNADFWRTGLLVYENASVTEVVTDLNKHFETTIQIENKSIGTCKFTSSFQHPSVEEVLEIMTASMNLQFEKTSTGYSLTGEGCNQFTN